MFVLRFIKNERNEVNKMKCPIYQRGRISILLFLIFVFLVSFFNKEILSGSRVAIVFSTLMIEKKFIGEFRGLDDAEVKLYVEKDGPTVTSIEILPQIIKKSYKDFPLFLKKYYPYIPHFLPLNLSPDKFKIIVVDSKTYRFLDEAIGDRSVAMYQIFLGNILLCSVSEFDMSLHGNKEIIRHEIFHRLVIKYRIKSYFSVEEEERAAELFQSF